MLLFSHRVTMHDRHCYYARGVLFYIPYYIYVFYLHLVLWLWDPCEDQAMIGRPFVLGMTPWVYMDVLMIWMWYMCFLDRFWIFPGSNLQQRSCRNFRWFYDLALFWDSWYVLDFMSGLFWFSCWVHWIHFGIWICIFWFHLHGLDYLGYTLSIPVLSTLRP